jgi:hypothetical protein
LPDVETAPVRAAIGPQATLMHGDVGTATLAHPRRRVLCLAGMLLLVPVSGPRVAALRARTRPGARASTTSSSPTVIVGPSSYGDPKLGSGTRRPGCCWRNGYTEVHTAPPPGACQRLRPPPGACRTPRSSSAAQPPIRARIRTTSWGVVRHHRSTTIAPQFGAGRARQGRGPLLETALCCRIEPLLLASARPVTSPTKCSQAGEPKVGSWGSPCQDAHQGCRFVP